MGKHAHPDTAPMPVVVVPKTTFWEKLDKYAKFMVALAGALAATGAQVGLVGTPNSWQDWVQIGIYFLTAAGVHTVPNKEKG